MRSSVVAPPAAQSTPRRVEYAFGTLALFVALAGDGIRNLLGLWGFTALCVIVSSGCVVLMVRARPRLDRSRLPQALMAFLAFSLLSTAWSAYPGATLLTLFGMLMCTVVGAYCALMFSWDEILIRLANALKWVVALSLLFELFVAVIIRDRVLPFWQDFSTHKPVLLDYWSRNLLFEGGRIQGIHGNSNLLAICALLAIIVFAIQLWNRSTRTSTGIVWLVLAGAVFLLTRSSTMIIAAIAVAIVVAAALIARRATPSGRVGLYGGLAGLLALAAVAVIFFSDKLLALFGKSEDLTGRIKIWSDVIERAQQRPWLGWGYSSPWVPWVEPFDHFVTRRGELQLQAHNAWLDVWMQLGIVGVVLFAALIVSICWRSWFAAIDRPRYDLRTNLPYSPVALLPLLVITVLVVQSIAESRILIESGWVLLVLLALKTKQQPTIARPESAGIR